MKLTEKYAVCIAYFQKIMPSPQCELNFSNEFELLVAVILSAQCTDKRVNTITPALFAALPTPEAFANTTIDGIYYYIRSCSYPNNKAKLLHAAAKMLLENYGGKLPQNMEELQNIPGVGRKTANVLCSVLWHQPTMAVDTHVFRVANRIGLTKAKNVLETEKQLLAHTPKDALYFMHHWLILHGRYCCTARKPHCERCELTLVCDYFNNVPI
ncbi:MAG: endonuclease III [Bacteroidales bacterium]|jgi:endonuclease-3|nr:endonuclease III [Bacteroidales bacterium]